MAGVVTKTRHQDQRRILNQFLQFHQQIVATDIRQANVGDDRIVLDVVRTVLHHQNRLVALVGGFHHAARTLEQAMGRRSNLLVGIDYQNSHVRQRRSLLGRNDETLITVGNRLPPDLVNVLLDFSGVRQNRSQPFGDVRVVADVAFNRMNRVVQDFIDRKRDRVTNGFNAFERRVSSLCIEQL